MKLILYFTNTNSIKVSIGLSEQVPLNMKIKFILEKFHRLLNQQQASQGFTLIELVIAMLFAATLSLIAYPQLISQVGKAREAEAKNTLGAINRTQQAYRFEKGEFATSLQQLSLDFTIGIFNGDAYDTNFYHYEIKGTPNENEVHHLATPQGNYRYSSKSIASAVFNYPNDFSLLICQGKTTFEIPGIIDSQTCQNGEILTR